MAALVSVLDVVDVTVVAVVDAAEFAAPVVAFAIVSPVLDVTTPFSLSQPSPVESLGELSFFIFSSLMRMLVVVVVVVALLPLVLATLPELCGVLGAPHGADVILPLDNW